MRSFRNREAISDQILRGLSFLGAEELASDVDDPASDGQKAESVEGDREKSDPDGEGAQDGQQEFHTQEGTD